MIKLMLITNNPEVAKVADETSIDRIFIDLEQNGKNQRQANLDTLISNHKLEDIKEVKKVLKRTDVLVRLNSFYNQTKHEVEQSILYGADIIMLPYFKTAKEVFDFVSYVDGRARVCILLETKEAVECLDDILKIKGIDEIHIGLNDLAISYGFKFMFESLQNGLIEEIVEKIKKKHICFGIGGIAKLGYGLVPAEYIIAEHYRLGSQIAILSRSFYNANVDTIEDVKQHLAIEIEKIRAFECGVSNMNLEENKKILDQLILNVIKEN